MTAPSLDVLRSFDVQEKPVPIQGGRGLCYRAGDVVLRPSDGDTESQWISELLSRLPASSEYSVPRPKHVSNCPGQFVSNGWTASSFVVGTAVPNKHFAEILHVCQAFHADIAKMNLQMPDFVSQRRNRWHEADLVTWGEKELQAVDDVDEGLLKQFSSVLEPLKQMMQPLSPQIKSQFIHGDMTGNVLFEDGHPPSIIDITPYWRPAEYAAAIVVADGLAWHNQGQDLVELYGLDSFKLQLLIRALYWRCLTLTIDPDLEWIRQNAPKANYPAAVSMVRDIVDKTRLR